MRIFIRVILFLLPFFMFWLWFIYAKKHRAEDGTLAPEAERAVRLTTISGLLLFVGLIAYELMAAQDNRDEAYHRIDVNEIRIN